MGLQDDTPRKREPFLNVPASVVVLIGLLAAAHAARVLSPAAVSDRILSDYALNPVAYSARALQALGVEMPSLSERVIPLFSHMFLHANLTHIALNCVWLLAFGPVIARRFGGLAFYVFFLLCGIASAAGFVALDWGQNIGAIGASGAISGLMGGAIRMMRIREPYLNVATLPLQPLFSSQVLSFSAVWMVVNFIAGIFAIGVSGSLEVVAWQGHLGGYIAGLLLAGPFDHFVGLSAKLRRAGA
jgi:membrane associated rhomboid family serine protease